MAQGTDGLSRGIMTQGVMRGMSFSEFVPLHLNPVERQGMSLVRWVEDWFGSLGSFLWSSPEDWFCKAHIEEHCVWNLAPAAAQAALGKLAKSVHKRPSHTHVVLIPRLMTVYWRKSLNKSCDLVFEVPIETDVWSNTQFEPLIIGICLPLSRHSLWKLRGTALLDRVGRLLRGLPTSDIRWGRTILQQLLQQTRSLESLHTSMVRDLLRPAG
jgi:hypothetical protein